MRCLPRLVVSLVWCLLGASRLLAQDVTVSPIMWADKSDAPDELPTLKDSIRPEFPPELKKTTEIGWGCLELLVSEKGVVLTARITATQPRYQRAMEIAWDSTRRFKPALRDKHPVDSKVRIYIIFNPKSADQSTQDASPRLLSPALIIDPATSQKPGDPMPSPVFSVALSLNAQGRVVSVKDAPESQRALIESTMMEWQFAPARRTGAAIAADVVLPIIIVPPEMYPQKGQVPPRIISRRPPIYPFQMRQSGIRGEVLIEFLVDIEGRVRNPKIVKMLNPAFNAAALDAVRGWRFEPARVNGVPVNTVTQCSIAFTLDGEADGGSDGLTVTRAGSQDKMPEELKYDEAPKLRTLVAPVYPYALLSQKIFGDAQVSLLVGPTGKVLLTKVVKASRPEFGYALQAAVEHFQYEPALRHARPTNALIGFHQEFEPRMGVSLSAADRDALTLQRKHPEQVLGAKLIDGKLKPLHAESPIYPTSLAATRQSGSATLEFMVGEDGGVLLPRVISATLPEFGYAAAQAVTLWRFAPPTSKGKPCVTRVQVPITFRPTPPEQDKPVGAAPH
jgi:TonB family protein